VIQNLTGCHNYFALTGLIAGAKSKNLKRPCRAFSTPTGARNSAGGGTMEFSDFTMKTAVFSTGIGVQQGHRRAVVQYVFLPPTTPHYLDCFIPARNLP
jgi:hypothetical protein